MTYLVFDDILHNVAHEVVRQWEAGGARVQRSHLREVPRFTQLEHIVPDNNVRGDDLPAARVGNVRSLGVLRWCRRPPNDGVARVLRIPVRVFRYRRRILADDGVLESRLLKGDVPALDGLL